MQSEKKATKYLKAKNLGDQKQCQKELNTMIKHLFGDISEYKEVHDVAVALIKLGINTMPPINTQLKFLDEKPNSINQQMPSDMIAYHCMK